MKRLLLIYPSNEKLGSTLAEKGNFELVDFTLRRFPDGETYFRLKNNVKDAEVSILCSLYQPDDKILQLVFMAETCRENGAAKINLIAPYLAYMRQDKIFKEGEGVTAKYFAKLVSTYFDKLITVEPHLHRFPALSSIYTIPTQAISSAPAISKWINRNVTNALLIGPDIESTPWVERISQLTDAPYVVLTKVRSGDKAVELKIPDVEKFSAHTPILIDDIISTGTTMMKAARLFIGLGMQEPVCIAAHGIFSGSSYDELRNAGAKDIVSGNSIDHHSNGIDFSDDILAEMKASHRD